MARVSITKAAKLAGVSRSHLYKTYIDTGLLSLSKDEKDKPYIDTSELLRVFGTLKDSPPKTGQKTTVEDSSGHPQRQVKDTPSAQTEKIKMLEQQLAEAKEREAWYQAQVKNLTDTMKLLEGPKQPHYPRRWYQFWK